MHVFGLNIIPMRHPAPVEGGFKSRTREATFMEDILDPAKAYLSGNVPITKNEILGFFTRMPVCLNKPIEGDNSVVRACSRLAKEMVAVCDSMEDQTRKEAILRTLIAINDSEGHYTSYNRNIGTLHNRLFTPAEAAVVSQKIEAIVSKRDSDARAKEACIARYFTLKDGYSASDPGSIPEKVRLLTQISCLELDHPWLLAEKKPVDLGSHLDSSHAGDGGSVLNRRQSNLFTWEERGRQALHTSASPTLNGHVIGSSNFGSEEYKSDSESEHGLGVSEEHKSDSGSEFGVDQLFPNRRLIYDADEPSSDEHQLSPIFRGILEKKLRDIGGDWETKNSEDIIAFVMAVRSQADYDVAPDMVGFRKFLKDDALLLQALNQIFARPLFDTTAVFTSALMSHATATRGPSVVSETSKPTSLLSRFFGL